MNGFLSRSCLLFWLAALDVLAITPATAQPTGPSVANHASIQEALDRNPGLQVFVPSGDHRISTAVVIRSNGSGLFGPGRIIQTNPKSEIVIVLRAIGVRLADLTLTRSEGEMETHCAGLFVNEAENVVINNLSVIDNRSDLASIYVRSSRDVSIENSLVRNYSRISVDDRRRRHDVPNFDVVGGYAFRTISGSGIGVRASGVVSLCGNRVIEDVMIPTPELKDRHQLGAFTHRDPVKGSGLTDEFWLGGYNNGWHQGSAIVLANVGTDPLVQTNPFVAPELDPVAANDTDHHFKVVGNYIENAAQGIDIHVDHVIVAQNIVRNSFMGMKAVHGARNVIIVGNQFIRSDLWAILLMPGTTSQRAEAAVQGRPARPGNSDGGTLVAHNVISDFGHGHARWVWEGADPAPIFLNFNRARPDLPPLTDVLLLGNLVHDTGRDDILTSAGVRKVPPRYRFAVKVGEGPGGPRGLRFSANLFHPGTAGISNLLFDR